MRAKKLNNVMIRAKNIEELKKYFMKIGYIPPYETSVCIDLIFALVTNYAVKATTTVELSLSRFFKGSTVAYSAQLEEILHLGRIKKARTEERIKTRDRIKSFLFKSAIEVDNGVHSFAIDITGNVKKHSLKSEEGRIYIHSGSIGGISIGHNYSVVAKNKMADGYFQ